MDSRKLNALSRKLVSNGEDYMSSFRQNVFMYLGEKDITISKLAEEAELSESTLNSFLYGNSSDIMLNTAIKLATALHVSIDELVGAGTIDPGIRESVSICRNIPEHSLYLVRYFIKHQEKIYQKKENKEDIISVLIPQCNNGNLLTTNVLKPLNISFLPKNTKDKTYLGIKIPCDHYMPYYAPGDIILISSDRKASNDEQCVITYEGKIYIVTKKDYIEDGKKKYKYVSLMNDKFTIKKNHIDDNVGYIVGFLNPDLSIGVR